MNGTNDNTPRHIRAIPGLLPVAACLLMSVGCTRLSPVEWSEFAPVDPAGWDPVMAVEFTPVPPDSVLMWGGPCDVALSLRYKADASQSAVTLRVTEESAAGDTVGIRDVELPLFNISRRPSGRGNYAVFEISDTLRMSWPLPEGYTVTVALPPGAEPPQGLVDVGLVVTRSGQTSAVPMPHISL